MKPKTPEEVRREFREAGISVAQWARTHGFDRMTVVDLLRGNRKGNYGEAHRAAVALGLKVGQLIDVAAFKPLPAAAPSTRTGGARQRKAA